MNKPREKKCSKCIKYSQHPNKENEFICIKKPTLIRKNVDIAKECKCYEEQEE